MVWFGRCREASRQLRLTPTPPWDYPSDPQLGGYAMLREGEQFDPGMATMCDLQSAFPIGGHRPESPHEGEGAGEPSHDGEQTPTRCETGRAERRILVPPALQERGAIVQPETIADLGYTRDPPKLVDLSAEAGLFSRSPVPSSAAETSHQSCAINVADAACTLAAWLVLVLSMVASFEASKWLASVWPGSASGVGIVVLGTIAFGVWAVASSLLLFVFKSVLVGDFKGSLATGETFSHVHMLFWCSRLVASQWQGASCICSPASDAPAFGV